MATAPIAEQFAVLQILLKASKKDEVRQLCQECFLNSATGSEKLIEDICSTLSVEPDEAKQLICSLHSLLRHVVHQGLASPEEILSLFPEGFHQNLKNLLTKIILENLSAWRNEVQAGQISLPRLIDMDWRVDIKTSSDSVSRMAVPTCLLQLKIQEDAALCGNDLATSALTIELNKQTVDTMLDGLGRIRDQLSAVANK
ncbi:COMM domain-containing protein 9 [Heteronotia binoei]|uniref:COMM domain-containing protein 9 n=1 Tax=Heteronotia binoei TaxID=13085 RepID=UPI0029303D73|nr:COMM domain-containing protein 9 [Heteronotia binoei]